MFRELSQLLDELHDGLVAIQAREGMQLSGVEMTLPVELRPVLRDGGCVLLAEFPRSSGVDAWTPLPSRLVLAWSQDGAAATEATP
ncbi:hypothetical protein Psesu_0861 [Pseudoxanthomonas suwonensis 11-1]|uniref:Uncharacterized protein n=1 Tax=Pseudoxanthomonas suwonensis (strain 11-1) TaxID=743721 RepID=E6WRI2_PSEUU|nr:hypothetical protein [Pseudoxanthomonas suwonensis]ADV26713.1 hypothetical protein Psesu_0861 [Pseudoxanthomonas suwonensis 11-1]